MRDKEVQELKKQEAPTTENEVLIYCNVFEALHIGATYSKPVKLSNRAVPINGDNIIFNRL